MRALKVGLLGVAALAFASEAQARVSPFQANDTGGIIAWMPGITRVARVMAADHCAQYGKLARITSVRPHYGDYVGFICFWPRMRSYEVVRTRVVVRQRVTLRRKY